MKHPRRRLAGYPRASLLAVALLIASQVQAQSTDTASMDDAPKTDQTQTAKSAAETDEAATLDTVLVEAHRANHEASTGALGDKPLLDTPFSITVVNADDIELRQAASLGQVFINDPSVLAAEPSGTVPWWGMTIRGMNVGMSYVDGVPLVTLGGQGSEFPLEVVESVQALKGLGGFMYGFGWPGGVISYQTKQPTDERLLSTSFGWREGGLLNLHLDAGGRIDGDGSLGYRFNVATEHGEAYNGSGIDRDVVSLALDHPIGESLTWYAGIVAEKSSYDHSPLNLYLDEYVGDRPPEPTYDYQNVTVRNTYYDTDTLLLDTGLRWRINDDWRADFSLGEGRREQDANKAIAFLQNEAGDYVGYGWAFLGLLRSRVAQAIVQGSASTGAIRHDLVFGTSWERGWEQWNDDWSWEYVFPGNLYQRQDYLTPAVPDLSLAPVEFDERQTSLFASDTLHFGEHWQAILGLRHTRYEQKDVDGDPSYDSSYEANATTPTAALIWKPIKEASVYASYVESLESGSQVPFDADPPYANAGEVLPATISQQIEIGTKVDMGRWGLTAAAFRAEIAAQIDVPRDGEYYLVQDGLTLYRGFEASGTLAVTDDLDVGLGATWLDPTYEQLSDWQQDLEGNRVPFTSRREALAYFNWGIASVPGLSLHGNVRYSGETYGDYYSTHLIPGYSVTGVGFQYGTTVGGTPVTITGNINNLFNKKYWTLSSLGEARNAALDVRIDW